MTSLKRNPGVPAIENTYFKHLNLKIVNQTLLIKHSYYTHFIFENTKNYCLKSAAKHAGPKLNGIFNKNVQDPYRWRIKNADFIRHPISFLISLKDLNYWIIKNKQNNKKKKGKRKIKQNIVAVNFGGSTNSGPPA